MREGLCEAEESFNQFGSEPASNSGTIWQGLLYNSIL